MVTLSVGRLAYWLHKPTNQHTSQPLFVGHNRPYDQPFPDRLFIELKRRECVIIFRHWKFMFKRIFRVSECVDACIYTKQAREKSTKLTKLASCVLGRPKCFRRPKTTYRHPTLQSRANMMILHCKYTHKRTRYTKFTLDISKREQQVFEVYLKYTLFMYKFYAPNNHINYPNIHS